MIYPQKQEVKSFFLGQYFESGLRITFGILLPSLVFYYHGDITAGITLSLGALFVSITDLPGPVIHKRNGMLITTGFLFLTALLTGLINAYSWLLAIEIPLLCFFFAMLHVYGVRASLSGTAALLVMIISTDQNHLVNGPVLHAIYILCGGLWYILLSLSITVIMPYRLARQALGECILEVGAFLRLRARFYDDQTDIKDNYAQLVLQQINVNQHLDGVREILFKSKRMLQNNSGPGHLLIIILIDIIDLFEQMMTIPYDYSVLRERFKPFNILPEVSAIINGISAELENIGYALINNDKPQLTQPIDDALEKFKIKLDALEEKGVSVFVLKRVMVNLRHLLLKTTGIYSYFHREKLQLSETKADFDRFISHQKYDPKLLISNLTFESFTFRHAVRLALACFVGFMVAKSLSFGDHSYWILLTILVILKPAYGLTKQRNNERVIGTVAGGLIGILILAYIPDQTIRFVLLLIFMVLTFTFQRIRYVVSVVFMTPFLLILFSFVSTSGEIDIAKERIIDTLVGSLLAISTNYFIFPNWESNQVFPLLARNMKANLDYLKMVMTRLNSGRFSVIDYKYARKQVHVEAANLTSAFQRMLSEPKKRQKHVNSLHKFIVLNHILASHISTLSTTLGEYNTTTLDPEHARLIRKSQALLQEAVAYLDAEPYRIDIPLPDRETGISGDNPDMVFIGEQLQLIYKVANDLEKLSKKLGS